MILHFFASACAANTLSSLAQRLPNDLDLFDFPRTGRGLRTLRARAQGDELFSVRDSDVVRADRLLSEQGELAAAAEYAATYEGAALSDDAVLTCHLVAECQRGSDYADTLPAVQPSVVSMAAEDAALLPRCYARAAESMHLRAVKQHTACAAAFEAVGAIPPDLDAFLHAFAHVRARSVDFSAESGRGKSKVLHEDQTGGSARLLLLLA